MWDSQGILRIKDKDMPVLVREDATFGMRYFLANCINGLYLKFRRSKGRMRGGVVGNENIYVGGYRITQSFEPHHKISDTVLGGKSNWWAGMRTVSKYRWKLKTAAKSRKEKI